MPHRPILYIGEILAWADAHHARIGKWPNKLSGRILDAPRVETWSAIQAALLHGLRGLRRGNTLARLLEKHRGVRNHGNLPKLTHAQILHWARKHHLRTGGWPTQYSGPVAGTTGETWRGIETALYKGHRGLSAGGSLARVLESELGVRNKSNLVRLSKAQILAWADAYHNRNGKWPIKTSGQVYDAPYETWNGISCALLKGFRGLRPGQSLARLLEKHRGVRNQKNVPKLTRAQIVAWAKEHRRRTGNWPTIRSGPVPGAKGETWLKIQAALHGGARGLKKGGSLARVLESAVGVRNYKDLPTLTVDQILAWADLHYRKTGDWPTPRSGSVFRSNGETWAGIEYALQRGRRGLTGRTTLAILLENQRGVKKNYRRGHQISIATILEWAKDHYRRTGALPTALSGPVHWNPGERWSSIKGALLHGYRGLPKGMTLSKLLAPLKEKMARAGRR